MQQNESIEQEPVHVPVMPREVSALLAPPQGGCAVDATLGLGGLAAVLLEQIGPGGSLIGLDVDESNLQVARQRLDRWSNVRFFNENFENIEKVLREVGFTTIDTVIADLGFSSNQVKDPSRGFSFEADGPLDMRMDRRLKPAGDLVNGLGESELADLIYHGGQERFSRRIARAIHQARREARITTTRRLADVICHALHQDPDRHYFKIHPATRTFMALRIAVNHELESLERLLAALPTILKPGGRAGIISFHSLEDGLCKRAFRRMKEQGLVDILTKKPVTPSDDERRINPRSRSAKLRVIQRH